MALSIWPFSQKRPKMGFFFLTSKINHHNDGYIKKVGGVPPVAELGEHDFWGFISGEKSKVQFSAFGRKLNFAFFTTSGI